MLSVAKCVTSKNTKLFLIVLHLLLSREIYKQMEKNEEQFFLRLLSVLDTSFLVSATRLQGEEGHQYKYNFTTSLSCRKSYWQESEEKLSLSDSRKMIVCQRTVHVRDT